jgi:uroporphyrinogen-III synthase
MAATVLITRPQPAANAFAEDLTKRLPQDASVLISPLMEIENIHDGLPNPNAYPTWAITSALAIDFLANSEGAGTSLCYCVGDATTDKAREAGLNAYKGGDTAQLLSEAVIAGAPDVPIFYARGRHVSFDLAHALNSASLTTDEAIVYDQLEKPLSEEAIAALLHDEEVVLPLFSARSATLFFENCPKIARPRIVAISQNVADLVPENQARDLLIAHKPNASAMADAILNAVSGGNRLERGK